MNSDFIRRIVIYAVLLVILQIPMLRNWTVYGVAFPFPYIGLIILLPQFVSRSWHMVLAFFLGLIVDVFSNTPGMHAAASVFIAYRKHAWLGVSADQLYVDFDISVQSLGLARFVIFCMPLILVHHIMLFVLENEGFGDFIWTLNKAFWSSLLSFSIMLLTALAAIRTKDRL